MADSPYLDIRQELWRSSFAEAEPYQEYLDNSAPKHRKRWVQMSSRLPELEPSIGARLRGYHRQLNLLLVSGIWCGDCVNQGPIINQLVVGSDEDIKLRVIDRDKIEALRDELRLLGALRVPVLVGLTEDYFEVGRFGDRTLTTYREKAVNEVGASCPIPSDAMDGREFRDLQEQWTDVIERWILMARLSPPLRERHSD